MRVDIVIASDLTLIECDRVVMRAAALGELTEADAADRRAHLTTAAAHWHMLRISGEKRSEHTARSSTYHMMERAYGAFYRTFTLPRSVEADRAAASYESGVLTVRVPKRAGSGGHAVTIS